jgi:hypothetical protein
MMLVLAMVVLLLAEPAAAQSLTADLLVTNKPGTVFMRWEQGAKFELPNVKIARRGEPIGALVLFSGCAPDTQGNCDVRMDMTVLAPTGKVYGESKDTEVWTAKPAPSPGATQLGVGYMMIRIEPKDPPGKYRIKAHITDHIAKTSLVREWSFDVSPYKQADSADWPAGRPKPDLSGFWKDHCEDEHGLKIESAAGGLYSISFCGPGGCFEPGTYRPNSTIFGDHSYRVIDAKTIEVLGGDGFSTYVRCPGLEKR